MCGILHLLHNPIESIHDGDFWHFRPEKNFSQKSDSAMFLALLMRIIMEKNQKKLMMKSQENSQKLFFPAFSTGNEFFFENQAPSHFEHYHFASLCQNQEKLMSQSREKLVTNVRTDKRTSVNL